MGMFVVHVHTCIQTWSCFTVTQTYHVETRWVRRGNIIAVSMCKFYTTIHYVKQAIPDKTSIYNWIKTSTSLRNITPIQYSV